ncbi:rhodanese-related sulfurtransferase [Patescibacteria group bacterium]|nr:rhodanese-related sulfurtransferase [Patescibacteria group bacterium]MBU1754861.1 rhodanese-related sulfurtransferase [Patescibacteria group bacterium]
MTHQVLLFYKYVSIEDSALLRTELLALCSRLNLLGRGIVAEEGINITLEGLVADTEQFVTEIHKDPRFTDMSIKRSAGDGSSFPKLSIKVRDEIVGTHFPKEVDPRVQTAPRLTPDELKNWFENDEDFVIIDMRNDYEFRSGHFKNSINPGLEASRDLPNALPKLQEFQNKKAVTVCTGGVRCEKMSAYLLANGFSDVYQLEDGMHGYMEKYPGEDFLGTLYTFDQRKVMDFGGPREVIGTCHLCGDKTEQYANCKDNFCHFHFLVCDSCSSPDGTYCSETCKEKAYAISEGANV